MESSSILVFGMGLFLVAALLTYWPADPSFFNNAVGPAKNACGKVGAYFASMLLEYFGVASFLTPAAFFFLAATIHKREGAMRFTGTVGGMSSAVMALTVFLTLQWKYWPFAGTLLLTGGAFGAWLAELLLRQFNPLGSSLVSLFVFFLALVISTPVSVARAGAWVLKHAGRVGWSLLKLLGTYLGFLAGLVAMKGAHALGAFLQRSIESALERAKELKASREALRASLKEKKALEKAGAKGMPVIGLESASAGEHEDEDEDQEEDSGKDEGEDDEEAVAAAPMEIGPAKPKGGSITPVLGAGISSEAPNVLPELDPNGGDGAEPPAQLAGTHLGGTALAKAAGPAILPPQSAGGESAGAAAVKAAAQKAAEKLAKAQSRAKRGQWKLPSVEFLKKVPKVDASFDREKLVQNSQILKQKFADFGIDGDVTAVRPGPVITLYEFKPGPGVKVSRIAALADDLSMALSAQSVRILAPLPGKSVVGIEIPSDTRETVYMREFLQHPDFFGPKHSIPVVMGKDIGGQAYLSDLARMPHVLTAGQTGSGKSVFMNGLICSLLYRFTPDEMRMILVDPKFIEFRGYQDIPHLLLPVVDDPKQAAIALRWAVREMERRYRILAMMGSRNLAGFNQKVDEMGAEVVRDLLFSEENQPEGAEKMTGGDWIEAFEPGEDGAPKVGKLPYIVVIIDELADLMMIAKKEVEISIARIAQKARAAGIHLVIATQRPSTDVVTGLIKANLPSRVSFQLASYIDSKTILDRAGAERLLGQGDMLFIPPGVSQLLRLHGAYLDDDEIGKITSFLKAQGKPAYRDEILVDTEAESEEGGGGDGDEQDDALMQEAVELVKRSGHASASFLQRHLKVGYNRAARMIETMEMRGVVGPADGARPREVLIR